MCIVRDPRVLSAAAIREYYHLMILSSSYDGGWMRGDERGGILDARLTGGDRDNLPIRRNVLGHIGVGYGVAAGLAELVLDHLAQMRFQRVRRVPGAAVPGPMRHGATVRPSVLTAPADLIYDRRRSRLAGERPQILGPEPAAAQERIDRQFNVQRVFAAHHDDAARPIELDADADAGDAVGNRCWTQMPGAAKHERLTTSTTRNTGKETQPLRERRAGHRAGGRVDRQPAGSLAHLEIGGRRGAELLKVVRPQIGVVGRLAVPVDLSQAQLAAGANLPQWINPRGL